MRKTLAVLTIIASISVLVMFGGFSMSSPKRKK